MGGQLPKVLSSFGDHSVEQLKLNPANRIVSDRYFEEHISLVLGRRLPHQS